MLVPFQSRIEGERMRGKTAAAEDLTAKKELALEVIRRLKAEYPDAGCTLDYDHAWQLLVSVRLAAQCTDARVNVVVQDLFEKYPSVAALAEAEPEDIEAIVKPCGLGRSKARDISACMRRLRDDYGCKVPTTLDELLALPGVGRKTANVVQAVWFGRPTLAVDTHVYRVSHRLGLVPESADTPRKVEDYLMAHIPEEDVADAHHWLLLHGRYVCQSVRPKCGECPFDGFCPKRMKGSKLR